MITIDNYFSEIEKQDRTVFPDALNNSHAFVAKATNNGSSWSAYHSSEGIKKTIDLYFEKLNEFLNANKTAAAKQPAKKKKHSQTKHKQQPESPTDTSSSIPKKTRTPPPPKETPETVTPEFSLTERIPEELRFIKRFVSLQGKTKTKEQVLSFINALQKAILEKRIRKTSPYAQKIESIQDKLISLYNTMKAKVRIELKPETYDELKQLTGEQKVLPSIGFIKRYIGMNGKPGMKERARKLLAQIERAFDKGKITESDHYISKVYELKRNLQAFTKIKGQRTLEIEKTELNGLHGILGCACQQVRGLDGIPAVMNSMEFANMQFKTLGFTGKWRDFIGDPSPGFTAMVFGKPKFGKSTLCLEFAHYLASNHGKVLYVANEEKLAKTLQDKVNRLGVSHPNLTVSSVLDDDLSRYDFIFLDTVNKLGLKPEDLNRLKDKWPNKSFVFIFQVTKLGTFRGENAFQHDVDIVIEVPEWGRATQMGRFNQGGEMEIFSDANSMVA